MKLNGFVTLDWINLSMPTCSILQVDQPRRATARETHSSFEMHWIAFSYFDYCFFFNLTSHLKGCVIAYKLKLTQKPELQIHH